MSATDEHGSSSRPPRWRWLLIIGGPLMIFAIVGYVILTGGRFETTDDAYVQIAKAPVAPSIGGRVVEIYVTENQLVHKGDVLFRLDARESIANVHAAAAQVASARLQYNAISAAYRQQQASVQGALETADYSHREANRTRDLAIAGVASQQDVAKAVHAAALAKEQVAVAQQAAAQALASLGGETGRSSEGAPAVMQALAQLERAQLAVTNATVVAPADGVVTRVQQMPVGTYLNPSQTAFWLLSGQPWIEANFKEDQLGKMKIGQPVEVHVDAFPKAELHGRIASFSPGTGAAFSLLPAQNATGNWVKVSQRLPVRVEIDHPPAGLAAGLSARVKVAVLATAKGDDHGPGK
jgi:membrane fusion protein, multidrug efflux system